MLIRDILKKKTSVEKLFESVSGKEGFGLYTVPCTTTLIPENFGHITSGFLVFECPIGKENQTYKEILNSIEKDPELIAIGKSKKYKPNHTYVGIEKGNGPQVLMLDLSAKPKLLDNSEYYYGFSHYLHYNDRLKFNIGNSRINGSSSLRDKSGIEWGMAQIEGTKVTAERKKR